MGWLVHSFGWESVFFVMGGLGIVMAFIWLKTIYGPKDHPRANAAEARLHRSGAHWSTSREQGQGSATTKLDTWSCIKQLLGNRMLLGVYIGQYCINTLTYFFLTWFPCTWSGTPHDDPEGRLCGRAAGRGRLPRRRAGRRDFGPPDQVGQIAVGGAQDAYRVRHAAVDLHDRGNYVEADWVVILVMSLAFFGKGIGALGWAVVADTSPKEAGGMSGALFNTFGNTAGITTPIVIGYILEQTGSFSGALVFVGANALVTILCYLLMVGEIKRFEFKTPVMRRIEEDRAAA
jgi:ACS family glucarate transporter-like MFS transporter